MNRVQAIFFDVDFTLIHPGPRFQGSGYAESCRRHGVTVDPGLFDRAVADASALLDSADQLYDADLFVNYTRGIVERMGGTGTGVDRVAREIYAEWAEHHHFELYHDVTAALADLSARGYRLGLISNSHRSLDSFQTHFGLDGLIAAAVSSAEHGFLKPHPSIFRAALDRMAVPAHAATMVGDHFAHDVQGALDVGMRAVLLARGGSDRTAPRADVPVIASLHELARVL